jgi:flavin-dependent dehydrogenase
METMAMHTSSKHRLFLQDGASVGVVGGGPAGSFFAYFLLAFSERARLRLSVDVYEPRDFANPAPLGCNMCGGIISESLVQMLAAEGIELPGEVIQRGIDSYVLHTDVGSARIDTPLHEQRIGAVHRGAGPRDVTSIHWRSFDGLLLSLAADRGARILRHRVDRLRLVEGRPTVEPRGGDSAAYDLLAVATGVNSASHLCDEIAGYKPPRTAKAYIREYFLGEEGVARAFGSSMHVFLPSMPEIEFAAIIPKGEYATLCLLGNGIDTERVHAFMNMPWVRARLPEGGPERPSCACSPRLSVWGAGRLFADRLVFVGDSGVTRLYKDGIGAAYRTAKAAAATAVFQGVGRTAFQKHYLPACRRIERDNRAGRLVFRVARVLRHASFARRAVLNMTREEQALIRGDRRRMSLVLWNVFTGSEPYRSVLLRTLHPAFLGRLVWHLGISTVRKSGEVLP